MKYKQDYITRNNMYDYHIHSYLSGDSKDSMEELCEAAIKHGIKEIAFTEHLDINKPTISESIIKITQLNKQYDKSLKILSGLEVNSDLNNNNVISKIISNDFIDIVIFGIHDVNGIDLHEGNYFFGKTKFNSYYDYYKEVFKSISCFKNFDILAHFDLIRRYDKSCYKFKQYIDHKDMIEEILKLLIYMGKGIEINTSGFRYGLNSTLPNIDIIRSYKELGGEIITIGSDAHSSKYVGSNFKEAYEILQRIGVKYIAKFKRRKITFEKYDSVD